LAVHRGLVAAQEFEAVDVVAVGREGGVFLFAGGVLLLGRAGEGLPGLGEVVVAVFGQGRVEGADIPVLEAYLGFDEGGFEADEAGLTPTDGGELVNERLFHVVLGEEGGADSGEVVVEGWFVLDAEEDVDGGGESMFEGVRAGDGLSFDGGRAVGFGPVDAGLFRLRISLYGGRVRFFVLVGHGE